MADKNNISRDLRIRQKIQPETYFEELAKEGVLHDFLMRYYSDRLKRDTEFRNDVYDLIVHHDDLDTPVVQKYLLERMVESLSYFEEYTAECRKQTK